MSQSTTITNATLPETTQEETQAETQETPPATPPVHGSINLDLKESMEILADLIAYGTVWISELRKASAKMRSMRTVQTAKVLKQGESSLKGSKPSALTMYEVMFLTTRAQNVCAYTEGLPEGLDILAIQDFTLQLNTAFMEYEIIKQALSSGKAMTRAQENFNTKDARRVQVRNIFVSLKDSK
jgi:hypothetical protein